MAPGAEKKIFILIIKISTSNITLRTRNLEIGYKGKKKDSIIASNINLDIYEGELVAVIGVNGVGKSTLLRSLSGVQEIISGEVLIKEENIQNVSALKLSELISVVLTGQPYSKNLTVLELITLGRQPYTNWIGSLTQNDREHIKSSLELIDIQQLQEKKCYELSDGQLQKVLIGRALAQDTPVVLLDEPTTHLDIYHQAYVLKLLKKLTAKTRKSIIFSTHEINLALQLCDRLVVMEKDGIVEGSPAQLLEMNVFSRIFPEDLIVFDKKTLSFKIKT